MFLPIVISIAIGYALGNFNGAIMFSKLLHREDIREKGSGNAGLTNYFRNYKGWDALAVILVDAGKALLACLLGRTVFAMFGVTDTEQLRTASMLCGSFAVIGHIFPVLFGFRGGKGIMTCGALAAYISIWAFLICISVFLLIILLTRYVSLGSIIACFLCPFMLWAFVPQNPTVILMAAVIAALAIVMHRANIVRLLKGAESKLTFHNAQKQ